MSIPVMKILAGTPPWVFALFAYLAYRGARRLRTGVAPVAKVFVMPALFVAWGLIGLFGHDPGQTLLSWLAGAAAGGVLGVALPVPLEVDARRKLVLQAGSAIPLARILAIFGAHYALNVAAAMHPAARAAYLAWDVVVSGVSAGYFSGWALRFRRAYRAAPRVDLGEWVDAGADRTAGGAT